MNCNKICPPNEFLNNTAFSNVTICVLSDFLRTDGGHSDKYSTLSMCPIYNEYKKNDANGLNKRILLPVVILFMILLA